MEQMLHTLGLAAHEQTSVLVRHLQLLLHPPPLSQSAASRVLQCTAADTTARAAIAQLEALRHMLALTCPDMRAPSSTTSSLSPPPQGVAEETIRAWSEYQGEGPGALEDPLGDMHRVGMLILPEDGVEEGAHCSSKRPREEENAAGEWEWRKYGQKDMKDTAYVREYFRCAQKESHGCLATRLVDRHWADASDVHVIFRKAHNHAPVASQVPPHLQKRQKKKLTTMATTTRALAKGAQVLSPRSCPLANKTASDASSQRAPDWSLTGLDNDQGDAQLGIDLTQPVCHAVFDGQGLGGVGQCLSGSSIEDLLALEEEEGVLPHLGHSPSVWADMILFLK